MKIHVGSKNKTKLQSVIDAVALYPDLFSNADIVGVDVVVEEFGHPKNLSETVSGAIARAKNAFPGSDYSFGLEGGLIEVPYSRSGYMEVGVCAVYDGTNIYLGLGPAFEYPQNVLELIISGKADASQAFKQLGLTDHEKIGAVTGGISGFLTDGRLPREDFTKYSIIMALIQIEKSDLYMTNIIVTSGQAFTDIDALACAVAYTELLKLEGKQAEAVLPGPLNHSVTDTVKKWDFKIETAPTGTDLVFVLVDTSNLESFASFVREDSIVEIYDHHYGSEEYWNEKLKEDSHIDMIGAAATLIWEQFKKRGFADKITVASANLLATAIISNTLNFGAQITDQRDIDALDELKKHTDLPENWTEQYFEDQEKTVYADIQQSIIGDTKIVKVPTLPFSIVIGQMELWDSGKCLTDNMTEICKTLESFNESHWILSLPSISEKRNYLYSEDAETRKIFSDIIGASWNGSVGMTEKLWLRKEIRKKLYEYIMV